MIDKPAWIQLDGAVNVRDLGGSPAGDRVVQPHRLVRADNLQDLTAKDVTLLLDGLGVRRVADLRSDVEVRAEGPGPLAAEPLVKIEHLSLFPDSASVQVAVTGTSAGPEVLPWQNADAQGLDAAHGYLRFLAERPDSVLAALRLIATCDGATLVHCAAGKDRTGVIVALALAAVGVPQEAIVADYALSAQRIDEIIARLAASPTYAQNIRTGTVADHAPQGSTMARFLQQLQDRFGGVAGWLASHGWTGPDQAALERALLDE